MLILPSHGGRRLSRPGWLVMFWDGLPACREWPIHALARPGIGQLVTTLSGQLVNHCTMPPRQNDSQCKRFLLETSLVQSSCRNKWADSPRSVYMCVLVYVVGRINEVNQRRARLVLGWVTPLPPRVGKVSTGDDYGHRQGRNGEFCITVLLPGLLTYWPGPLSSRLGLYASLIGFNPRQLKMLKRGWAPTQRT